MPANEGQPDGVGTGYDRRFGAGHIGHRAILGNRAAHGASELIDQIQARQRWRGQNHDLGVADRVFKSSRGRVDRAVRKSLTQWLRIATPGSYVPPSGPIPFMKGPSNGAADQSQSNNRYSHGSIMAAPRPVGRIIGGLLCGRRSAPKRVISVPNDRTWAEPAQSGSP